MKSWPESPRFLGHPHPRVDGPAKVSGHARYASDMYPREALFGMILRATRPAGVVTAVDLAGALAVPGVKAAVLARPELPIRVRYQGQEIAAVAAESREAARAGLAAIRVTLERQSFVVKELEAVDPRSPEVFADSANLGRANEQKEGDPEAAFADAAAQVESHFATQVQLHHPMETHGNTVAFDGTRCTCWASTQGIFSVRDGMARSLGIPESQVQVLCDYMGGGFGAKFGVGVEGVLAARLSQQAGGRPVRLMLTRFDEALAAGNRPSTFAKVALGADAEGKLTAYRMDGFGCAGFAGGASTEAGGGGASFVTNYLYEAPHRVVKQTSLAINTGAGRAFRAPGHPPGCFMMESLMDELALRLGRDPLEFRLLNDPNPIRRKQFEIGAERVGWRQNFRAAGSGPGPLKRGLGCAGARWGGGGSNNSAEARLNPDGTIEVRIGTQDLGTGTRTLVQLVAAEILGVEPGRVTAHIGDTHFPYSGGSGGSNTAASVCPAVAMAASHARERLLERSGFTPETLH
jgi:xanthine dehydrogenase YagR molybdenum-binding subunit